MFLDPKLYGDGDGTVPKHDVTYNGKVEVIFRPKTDTSVISLHMGLLQLDGDPMLKRRLSMDTPTDQVLKVSVFYSCPFGYLGPVSLVLSLYINYFDRPRVLRPAVFALGDIALAFIRLSSFCSRFLFT